MSTIAPSMGPLDKHRTHTHSYERQLHADRRGWLNPLSLPPSLWGEQSKLDADTHTHTPPDLEQPPLTDRSATVLSRKPCLP
ncbi:hypothetical protein QQF64_019304 [Cirrhinus molitorella]|uniref:Prolactin receptor n=1 Tax=Cirrhinus molitorella TaxID=172907 RepID=A0ABR3LJ44_9TELE